MESSALDPVFGGSDDEFRHGGEIAEFEKRRGDSKIPVVLVDLLLEDIDSMVSPSQSAIAPHDSDVIPHKTSDLIPVLTDHDGLVAFSHFPVKPFGDVSEGKLVSHAPDGFVGRRFGEDKRLEQGV